jgi:uncharacterized protein (TIGR02466 family)
MKFTIENLFPIPVQLSSLERKFTKQELIFIKSQENKTYLNEGNSTSNNHNILEHKLLKNLKKIISNSVNIYAKEVLNYENVEFYITQSWLNYTKKSEYHHTHAHPNSIISGVLYINTCEEDKIYFYKNGYNQISPKIKKYNIYNSSSWWFPVKNGDIILFPSSTTHGVNVKEKNNVRISLAFNTFVKGVLGIDEQLTQLVII